MGSLSLVGSMDIGNQQRNCFLDVIELLDGASLPNLVRRVYNKAARPLDPTAASTYIDVRPSNLRIQNFLLFTYYITSTT
jgi:hypothetical protein